MEDLEKKALFHRLMDAKALAHLNTARKRVQHQVNPHLENLVDFDINARVEHELAISLVKNVMNDVKSQIKITKNDWGDKVYSIDLMVMPTEIFHYAINVIIKNMTEEQILKIRKDER